MPADRRLPVLVGIDDVLDIFDVSTWLEFTPFFCCFDEAINGVFSGLLTAGSASKLVTAFFLRLRIAPPPLVGPALTSCDSDLRFIPPKINI